MKQSLDQIFNVNQPQKPSLDELFGKAPVEQPKQNYVQRVGAQFDRAGQRIISGIKEGAQDIQEGDTSGGVRAGLRTVGSVAGAAFAPVLEAPGIKQGVEAVVSKASEVPFIQQLASKGIELSQKYPQASKDIEDIVNIATLGLGQSATKPIQSIATDTAKSISSGIKGVSEGVTNVAKKIVPKSDEIMNRVARLTPKEANNFTKLSGGISHGEYLTKTGNFGTPDQIIKKEAEKFMQSKNSVDMELSKLPGLYKDGSLDDALNGLVEKAKSVSSENVKSPYLQQVLDLQVKNATEGLSMEEINTVKRLYERNVKLGYNKLMNADKVEQATNVDNALREWQVNQAENLGFTNLKELNKQTQLSRFIVDKLGSQVIGKNGLNSVGLTDWIMLSGGDPTAVGGFLTKKFFGSKAVQSRIAKMLSSGETTGMVTPKVTPSKKLLQQSLEIKSEKALPKSSQVLPKKSSKLSTNKQAGFLDLGALSPKKVTSDIKDAVSKELNNLDTKVLTVNGKPDLSKADTQFRLDQLKTILDKRALTNKEVIEANKLLDDVGIDVFPGKSLKAKGAIPENSQTLYHGGSKIDEVKLGKSNFQKTFYMSDNAEYAKSYGGSKSTLNEMFLDKNAKMADMRKPSADLMSQIKDIIESKPTGKIVKLQRPDGSILELPETKGGKSSGVYSTKRIMQGIKDGDAMFAELPEVKQALKKLGYDGQITTESKFGSNYGVWNKDVIKVKSQLTDIYNKAVGKK